MGDPSEAVSSLRCRLELDRRDACKVLDMMEPLTPSTVSPGGFPDVMRVSMPSEIPLLGERFLRRIIKGNSELVHVVQYLRCLRQLIH
jgi:hypothetical protein